MLSSLELREHSWQVFDVAQQFELEAADVMFESFQVVSRDLFFLHCLDLVAHVLVFHRFQNRTQPFFRCQQAKHDLLNILFFACLGNEKKNMAFFFHPHFSKKKINMKNYVWLYHLIFAIPEYYKRILLLREMFHWKLN